MILVLHKFMHSAVRASLLKLIHVLICKWKCWKKQLYNIYFVPLPLTWYCLTEEAGRELASSLNSAGPGERALFVKCDISKQDDVEVGIQ